MPLTIQVQRPGDSRGKLQAGLPDVASICNIQPTGKKWLRNKNISKLESLKHSVYQLFFDNQSISHTMSVIIIIENRTIFERKYQIRKKNWLNNKQYSRKSTNIQKYSNPAIKKQPPIAGWDSSPCLKRGILILKWKKCEHIWETLDSNNYRVREISLPINQETQVRLKKRTLKNIL